MAGVLNNGVLASIRHYGSDVNDRTTGSFSPTPGRRLLVFVDSQNQSGNLTTANGDISITVSSGSWSWTYYGNASANSIYDLNTGSSYYGRVHAATAIVPAGIGSVTLTVTFNGGGGSVNRNRNTVIVDVIEVVDSDGIVQSIVAKNATSTSLTANLATTPDVNNAVFSFVGVSYDTDHTTITAATGHEKISEYDTANVDFNHSMCDSFDLLSPGSALNYGNFPSTTYGAAIIGLEVKKLNKGIPPGILI